MARSRPDSGSVPILVTDDPGVVARARGWMLGPSRDRLPTPAPPSQDKPPHVEVSAGSHGNGEYRCSECGYGIVTHGVVPSCPMCNGVRWLPRSPRAR